jgi:hypothetical protein
MLDQKSYTVWRSIDATSIFSDTLNNIAHLLDEQRAFDNLNVSLRCGGRKLIESESIRSIMRVLSTPNPESVVNPRDIAL